MKELHILELELKLLKVACYILNMFEKIVYHVRSIFRKC
jgi:hypothetical protein